METTCAVCRLSDGLVVNIIVADPSDPAPAGCQLAEVMAGQMCGLGWFHVDGTFRGPRTFAMCRSAGDEVVSLISVSFVSPVPAVPDGYYVVEVPEGSDCGIGWAWDGVTFHPPEG